VATRRYDSSSRRAAAEENRIRLATVAHRLFVEQGYAATTITRIAEEASLAPQTVYATFGSKPAILEYLIASTVNVPSPPATQSWMIAATQAPSAAERIAHLANGSAMILERAGGLFVVLNHARLTDPELLPLWDQGQSRRLDGITRFVRAFDNSGFLLAPVDPELAIDAVWALTSPEIFALLTEQRGWPPERYREWVRSAITAELRPSHNA